MIPKLCSGIRFLLSRFLCFFLGCFWISGGGWGGGWKGTPRRGVTLDYNLKVCFSIYSSSSRVETVMYSEGEIAVRPLL